MHHQGLIFIISAPSGTGKTTLVKSLLKTDTRLQSAITHTTRPKRPGEIDGIHYHFVSKEIFLKLKAEHFFVETAEVYGEYYGTSKNAVTTILNKNHDVILNIEWQGARNFRAAFKNQTISIFILPPSLGELRARMATRGDQDQDIQSRLKFAEAEIAHVNEYDYRIINDDLKIADEDLKAIIRAERLKTR